MFTKILVATDDSEHAHKAVAIASDLATRYDAELFLLYIIQARELTPEFRHMAEVEH